MCKSIFAVQCAIFTWKTNHTHILKSLFTHLDLECNVSFERLNVDKLACLQRVRMNECNPSYRVTRFSRYFHRAGKFGGRSSYARRIVNSHNNDGLVRRENTIIREYNSVRIYMVTVTETCLSHALY